MTKAGLARSVASAVRGIGRGVSGERNIKIQIVIGVCAVILAVLLKIPAVDFIIVIIIVFLVIILELFNTAFERYIDIVTPERRPEVGAVKDIMAGAVLLAVVLSVVVGVFIFIGPVTDAVKKMLGL